MWEWLQSTDARKNSLAAKRREHGRLRGRIERLEDRAMLSATMGSMPQVGNGFAPQQFHGPHGGAMSIMASASYGDFPAARPEHANVTGVRSLDGAFGHQVQGWGGPGYGGHSAALNSGFSGDNFGSYANALNQYQVGPPVAQPRIIILLVVPSTARAATAPATSDSLSNFGNSVSEPPSQGKPRNEGGSTGVPRVSFAAHAPGSSPSFESPNDGFPTILNNAPMTSALAEIPSAAQILSGDINSAALLSSGAVDAAFQSYSPPLLLVTATSANDRALVKSLSDETPQGDALDGFISLSEFAIANDEGVPTNPVEREQAAVDEVLSGLQDLDAWPIEPSTVVKSCDDENAASATELGFAALANAEGGMVMLEANGDANYSDVNLANVADDRPDLLNVRVGVEASVGFYQAVDVATDELPAAAPVAEPARDNRVSTEGSSDSPRKAAGAVGATTLVGAMVWLAQRNRTNDAVDEKAERMKRLRRGNAS